MEPTREEQMLAAYAGGATLDSIGDRWGVSGERVRQIVKPLLTDELAEERAASVARRPHDRRPEITEYLHANPHESLSDVAERFDVDRRTVARLWNGSPRPRKPRVIPPKWSEEQMIDAMRTVLGDGPASAKTYREANRDGPSLALIIRHFGTWTEAVTAAGLTPIQGPIREYERATDDWDSLFAAAVREFMGVEMDGGHTWRHFAEWAKDRTPSPHSMRAMANITYGEAQRLVLRERTP